MKALLKLLVLGSIANIASKLYRRRLRARGERRDRDMPVRP